MKFFIFFILTIMTIDAIELKPWTKKIERLSEEEKRVIIEKGTERPFIGKYTNEKSEGTYVCKVCGTPLYKSSDKFESNCGWPSFDDEIKGAVKRQANRDCLRHMWSTFRSCFSRIGLYAKRYKTLRKLYLA